MSVIEIKNLAKTYKILSGSSIWNPLAKKEIQIVEALKNINLNIQEGEFAALLGPNGAGKSTLIKIMIGVLKASGGNIQVFGKDPLVHRQEIISRLGIVFSQRSRLQYDLPVKESLELTKRLYLDNYPKYVSAEQKAWFEYLVDSINIRELLYRPVKKLRTCLNTFKI